MTSRRALLVLLALLTACEIRVTTPWCPVSDSARDKADSIPLGCDGSLPDSVGAQP